MAVIAPTVLSQQMSNVFTTSGGTVFPTSAFPITYLRPNELGGRMRVAFFYFAPTANVAAGVTIGLCRLPFTARILMGRIMSNGAVSGATASIGISAADGSGVPDAGYADPEDGTPTDYDPGNGQTVLAADSNNFFSGNLAIATAGEYSFANTIALNHGYWFAKDCILTATLATAGMTGGTHVLQGWVMYVVD